MPASVSNGRLTQIPDAAAMADHVFREEYGRIIATLIRISRSFDLAEEALQESFAAAAVRWPRDGLPQNPGAWLTTVAHRKLLDALRREKTRADKEPELQYETERLQEYEEPALIDDTVEYPDDRLRSARWSLYPAWNASFDHLRCSAAAN